MASVGVHHPCAMWAAWRSVAYLGLAWRGSNLPCSAPLGQLLVLGSICSHLVSRPAETLWRWRRQRQRIGCRRTDHRRGRFVGAANALLRRRRQAMLGCRAARVLGNRAPSTLQPARAVQREAIGVGGQVNDGGGREGGWLPCRTTSAAATAMPCPWLACSLRCCDDRRGRPWPSDEAPVVMADQIILPQSLPSAVLRRFSAVLRSTRRELSFDYRESRVQSNGLPESTVGPPLGGT